MSRTRLNNGAHVVTRLPLPSRSPLRLARDAAGESEEVCASRVKSLGLRPAVWGGLLAPPPLSSRVDVWRRTPPGSHVLSPGSLGLRAGASSLSPSVAGIETGVAGGPRSSDYPKCQVQCPVLPHGSGFRLSQGDTAHSGRIEMGVICEPGE